MTGRAIRTFVQSPDYQIARSPHALRLPSQRRPLRYRMRRRMAALQIAMILLQPTIPDRQRVGLEREIHRRIAPVAARLQLDDPAVLTERRPGIGVRDPFRRLEPPHEVPAHG